MIVLTILLFTTAITGQTVTPSTSDGYTNYVASSTGDSAGTTSICTCGLPYNRTDPPDVWLTANVSVPLISLRVDNIRARLSLDIKAAGLVTLTAGVSVGITTVQLQIKEVNVQVQLAIKLDRVVQIVNDTLNALESSPLLVDTVKALQNVVSTVG